MGYRSHVRAYVRPSPHLSPVNRQKTMNRIVGTFKLVGLDWWETVKNHYYAPEIGWKEGLFRIAMDEVKFYEDYDDVQEFWRIWDTLSQIENAQGYYLRVGEDADDVEEKRFGSESDAQAIKSGNWCSQFMPCYAYTTTHIEDDYADIRGTQNVNILLGLGEINENVNILQHGEIEYRVENKETLDDER